MGGQGLRIFRHYLSGPALSLFLFESCVVGCILYAAVSQSTPLSLSCDSFNCRIAPVLISAILISIVMYATGVYDREHLSDLRQTVKRMLVSYIICAPILIVFMEYTATRPLNSIGERALFYALLIAGLFTCVVSARLT